VRLLRRSEIARAPSLFGPSFLDRQHRGRFFCRQPAPSPSPALHRFPADAGGFFVSPRRAGRVRACLFSAGSGRYRRLIPNTVFLFEESVQRRASAGSKWLAVCEADSCREVCKEGYLWRIPTHLSNAHRDCGDATQNVRVSWVANVSRLLSGLGRGQKHQLTAIHFAPAAHI